MNSSATLQNQAKIELWQMLRKVISNYKKEIMQENKTETYILKGVVKHAETMETLVLYEYAGKLWARPTNQFCDLFMEGKIKLSENT